MAGRRIDDHSFFAGKGTKDSVMPEGVHHKDESSAEGFGKLAHYEDTTEAIKAVQVMAKKDVAMNPRKIGHRN